MRNKTNQFILIPHDNRFKPNVLNLYHLTAAYPEENPGKLWLNIILYNEMILQCNILWHNM